MTASASAASASAASAAEVPEVDVAVIGGGFSGIGAGILLDRAGFGDYVVLEAGDGLGGAWHWNTYPGVAVDIPSFSYQFSFEQKSGWSRVYAPGEELKAYERPGFHPDDRDTTTLVAEWRERLFGAQGQLNDKLPAASAA